jgi:site-specific DNA-cytosine methylase
MNTPVGRPGRSHDSDRHRSSAPDAVKIMEQVTKRIAARRLSETEAAREIGIGLGSVTRHLAGGYVRSDSLAKYRLWLDGVARTPAPQQLTLIDAPGPKVEKASEDIDALTAPERPRAPHRVVDLFGGCGGLSLGFELAGGGGLFRTTLAVDLEEPMVRVFNANHPTPGKGAAVGRQADLSEFMNEAEVLAFYLDHLARLEGDVDLGRQLTELTPLGLDGFRARIAALDREFVAELTRIRGSEEFRRQYGAVSKAALSQTSVLGFHAALKLPRPGGGDPDFQPPLWGLREATPRPPGSQIGTKTHVSSSSTKASEAEAERLWASELARLEARAKGSGNGQLASAAQKIGESLELLTGSAYQDVRRAWVRWRARRDALRRSYFEQDDLLAQLRSAYTEDRRAQVLLGGPPCQGFSRIGRGKIRSLREQSVHVQSDEKAGDKRNELLLQYVLFVAALAPRVFLFENVRHFQAEVRTPDGTFKATEVLAEAIANVSCSGLRYDVHSRVVMAAQHLVPQTRERFFMLGVREDVAATSERPNAPRWCLALPLRKPVPLKMALDGLPEPAVVSAATDRNDGMLRRTTVEDVRIDGESACGTFLAWIRQPAPADRGGRAPRTVDAHCARDSRSDDRAFFEMLGPGKRWMDYRCDDNPIVEDLARLVAWAAKESRGRPLPNGLDRSRLEELAESLDGSLSLRLLLDRIPTSPGEVRHHLALPSYLKKREGSHGDWLARLDAETPSKTMVSHMGKDTYAFIHPSAPRTISVREAARVQTFPDWYDFGCVGLVDGYRVIGNAVPPLLSSQFALRVAVLLQSAEEGRGSMSDAVARAANHTSG